jgi:hypothetical protein
VELPLASADTEHTRTAAQLNKTEPVWSRAKHWMMVAPKSAFSEDEHRLFAQQLGVDYFGRKRYEAFASIPWDTVLQYAVLGANAFMIPLETRLKVGRLLCTRHGESLQSRLAETFAPEFGYRFHHADLVEPWVKDAALEGAKEDQFYQVVRNDGNTHSAFDTWWHVLREDTDNTYVTFRMPNDRFVDLERRHKQLYDQALSFIRNTLAEYRR